jgi:hypothetical protein
MVAGWIFEWNLRPFLEIAARRVGYGFGQDDWNAIHLALPVTDHEHDRWYEYEFGGPHPIRIRLAEDPGSSVVFVEVSCDPDTENELRVVIEIVQEYRLSK